MKTFSTCGDGYWSTVAKAVSVVDMQLSYVDDDGEFGELRVYFDTATWDTSKDGLIYTDSAFLDELSAFLDSTGLVGSDVDYSEQGMQGNNYVSLDVGEAFITSWRDKFNAFA